METLLLTWTISPSKKQQYQSTSLSSDIRKMQYLKSLIYYITQTSFTQIIFCENSNYEFNKSEITNIEYLSKLFKKNVELLHFNWNYEKVNKLWYWYGEWECLDYAINNSKYLNNTQAFYKITWRYIIWNINEIIETHENDKNLFIRDIPAYFTMNTAFFKMQVKLYKDYFYNAKKYVNHSNNENFESSFYKIIYNNKLFKYTQKLKILPRRLNYLDDKFTWSIHKYNLIKRQNQWYDYIWIKFGIYCLSEYDKCFYKYITPFTRRK